MKDHDDKPDRARRRLMKMAAYVPAGIVSLSAARAHAGRLAPTASVKNQVGTGVGVAAKAKAG
jgi:hypothetical protein